MTLLCAPRTGRTWGLSAQSATGTRHRTLPRSPVDEEHESTHLPVAAELAPIATMFVQAMRSVAGLPPRAQYVGDIRTGRLRALASGH
jgi:hypothetical protein